MKKIFLVYYILVLMSFVVAQSKTGKVDNTIISGHFSDGRNDTLTLEFYDEKLGNTRAGRKTMQQITNEGSFSFIIPITTELGYVTLRSSQFPNFFLYEYLVKKGDSIHVELNSDLLIKYRNYDPRGMTFSGKNSNAFKYRYYCDSVLHDETIKFGSTTISMRAINEKIELLRDSLIYSMDRGLNLHVSVLNRFSDWVEPLILETLKSDVYYQTKEYELMWFMSYWNKAGLSPDSSTRKEKMLKYYDEYFREAEKGLPMSMRAKKISTGYMDFICRRAKFEAIYEKATGSSTYDCGALIPYIEKAAPPELKEKLITGLIANLTSMSEKEGLDTFIRYGVRNVSDRLLQPIVESYFTKAIKGSAFFPFVLSNPSGKMIGIHDLRGKTVLIDFWYTGCEGCVQVGKAMKKIKELFKNDSSVVFMSISVDKDMIRWNEGLRSGLYTDKESINLYTMGKAENHELINYYYINAYPKLMLIDPKGKLFAFNAPRPDSINGVQNLSAMINEAKKQ